MYPNSVEVLLIEDNPYDAELIIRELNKHHLANNLFHVKDGAEALDFIFCQGEFAARKDISNSPKLILLDINMPKVNGIEVLQKLKSDDKTKLIPVVILTSSNEDPDIKKCYELGANGYTVKPVNFERFTETIRSLGFYWLLLNEQPR